MEGLCGKGRHQGCGIGVEEAGIREINGEGPTLSRESRGQTLSLSLSLGVIIGPLGLTGSQL